MRLLNALACVFVSGPVFAGPLAAAVSQARNDLGEVRCGLFDSAEGWRKEEHALRAVDAAIKDGKAACDFGVVPPGDYAVAVFHAEQGEPTISYGFLGKPRQGVGFSNNPSIAFGAPDFKAARVSVGQEALVVPILLKY
jgi:uncharacterized protein (DUF2141 family)